MLSVYGIMAQACSECNFQFLTLQSFEHHKLLQRCETYKSKYTSERVPSQTLYI